MKIMKKRILPESLALIMLISLVTITITLTKGSSSGTAMFISPSSIAVDVNQTFEIHINVSEISDLYGWEFKLSWNPTLLEAINVTENSFLGSGGETYLASKVNNIEGYILVGCTLLRNITGVNGNGTIATVKFSAENEGSCTLNLYDTKLVSSQKQLTSHNSIDGTVTIPSTPVGGIWIPVDKFSLLAPYIALVATIILAVSISVAYIKYRKK